MSFWDTDIQDKVWTFIWRVFTLIMLMMAAYFVASLVFSSKGSDLDDPNSTRGLIAVVLLVSTTILVVIIVLPLMTSAGSADDLTKRAQMSKDVIVPLFGIFGTVLGFYFGSQVPGPGPAVDRVTIEGPSGSIIQVKADATTTNTVDGCLTEISKGRIKINNKSYRNINGGDRVKIDESGDVTAVTINGQARKAIPPTTAQEGKAIPPTTTQEKK
jgi:hypothetical protein